MTLLSPKSAADQPGRLGTCLSNHGQRNHASEPDHQEDAQHFPLPALYSMMHLASPVDVFIEVKLSIAYLIYWKN